MKCKVCGKVARAGRSTCSTTCTTVLWKIGRKALDVAERMTPRTPKTRQRSPVLHMTRIERERVVDASNGLCEICGKASTGKRGLHIDHCHTTKKLRGMLCHGCNVGLGLFRDDVTALRSAVRYLIKHDALHKAAISVDKSTILNVINDGAMRNNVT